MIETQKLLAVWEANCALKDVRIRWYEIKENNDVIELLNISNVLAPTEIDSSHHVYKATIGPFTTVSKYAYEIVHKIDEKRQADVISSNSFKLFPENSITSYPIKIVAFSDNQFGLPIFNRLVQLAHKKHTPNFVLHAGDAVQHFKNLQQWQTDFYDPLTNLQSPLQTPLIYARGNHDHDPTRMYAYTTDVLWYSFSLANTRWIVLDSNVDDKRQDEWLAQELSSLDAQKAKFIIVVVHIPPFVEFWDPETWHGKNEKHWGEFVRTRFVPLFRKYDVDLVISGHQHNYQRGQLDGTVYTIIGGSGGELDRVRVEDWKMYVTTKETYHYVLMEIWADKIYWVCYDLNGSVIDKFELGK
ncbi:9164_t:CDS:1 [Acaulospora colombiana]|uniref:9164_t:CDS:1 n=1 Tax=Acaulospora colombiana TaxID=27376 RepID=A0ACA9LZB3_9GLOM|nr:9164_t:CDS:1 [Acaulospora colombiana]